MSSPSPSEAVAETTARPRRSFASIVLAGGASAALLAVAGAQTWARATSPAQGDAEGGSALRAAEAAGTDVAPLVLPLGLVVLACWGAVLVLRRRGRRVVTALGAVSAIGAVVAVIANAHRAPDAAMALLSGGQISADTTAWPWVALAAGVVTAACCAVAWRAAPSWPEMSARYDAPAGPGSGSATGPGSGQGPGGGPDAPLSDRDLWRALDEGHDPTV